MNKVSSFVGQHFSTVKKSGDNFITNCPFHDDKTPSFSIHVQNGYFLCFSCGERGSFSKLRSKMGDTSVSYNKDTSISKTSRKSISSVSSKEKNLKKDKKFNEQLALVTGYIKYTDENWDKLEKPNHWKKEVTIKNACWDWHTNCFINNLTCSRAWKVLLPFANNWVCYGTTLLS